MRRLLVALTAALVCGAAPPASGSGLEYPLWFTRDGQQVPREVLLSSDGLQHCWPGSRWLNVSDGLAIYVRDPQHTFNERQVLRPYDPDTELPPGAVDSGLRQDEVALWTSPTAPGVYAAYPNHTEFWPAVNPTTIACD
ncbi:MAG: hypothetical protein ACT4QG_00560 [Sporichthyaceae bacterium]